MILLVLSIVLICLTCPHTRGDDPGYVYNLLFFGKLVPIRVGMILKLLSQSNKKPPCPHTRGDDPKYYTNPFAVFNLSPYAWG